MLINFTAFTMRTNNRNSMPFQAYLDNIQIKTGKNPDDFKALAAQKDFIQKK